MVWPRYTLVALSALQTLVQSQQTITLTTRICSTSPTPSQRTTTIESFVPVYPVPWNDQIVNGGAPFVLRIELIDPSGYEGDSFNSPSWLLPNGNTTTSPGRAGQYTLRNGQLTSSNGLLYASAEVGENVKPLAVSSTIGAISRTFIASNNQLAWQNQSFTQGVAQFYKLPPNLLENASILAKLVGPMEPQRSWSAVRLRPEPVPSSGQPTSSPIGGTSAPTNTPGATGAPNPPPGASTGAPSPPGQSPASSISPVASTTSASPSPIPSNTTPDGSCGPQNGFTCIGAYSGSCCSTFGFCGTGPEYCGTGCQPGFGTCDRAPGEESSATLTPSSIDTDPTAGPASSSTTSASPPGQSVINTPASCPDRSGAVVRDANGIDYRLGCGFDASPPPYVAIGVEGGFNDCFELCDNDNGCAAFTYQGGLNGVGQGSCYLKAGPAQFQPSGDPTLVSAVRITPGVGTMTRTMTTSMSISSGQPQPSTFTPTGDLSTLPSLSSIDESLTSTSISDLSEVPSLTTSGAEITTTDASLPVITDSTTTIETEITLSTETTTSTTSAPPTTVPPGTPISTDPAKCPSIDNTIVVDAQGYQYEIRCQADSDGVTLRQTPSSGGGLQTCLAQCSNDDNCGGLVYIADEDQDDGPCYLKSNVGDVFRVDNPYFQVAIRVPGGPVTPTTTTTTSSTPAPVNTAEPTATPCVIDGALSEDDGAGTSGFDDAACELTLPFPMRIYGTSANIVYPNSNGVLSLGEQTTAFTVFNLPDTDLPDTSLLPFFDDFFIYNDRTSDTSSENPDATTGTPNGIYYTLSPSANPTSANITWVLSRAGNCCESYIFSLLYSSLQPGVVTYQYRRTGGRGSGTLAGGGANDASENDGANAAIGLQGRRADGSYDYVEWGYETAGAVRSGYSITCDTTVAPGICRGSDGVAIPGRTSS